MRTTDVLWKQHIGRGFKVRWLIQGRRKIPDTGVGAILAAKGVKIYDPKEILTPPFNRNHDDYIHPPEMIEEKVNQKKAIPCYVFQDNYSPPAGIAQVQHLTNCIVRSTLPQSVLNQVKDSSTEEDHRVKEAILHAHLLDSHQEKLPRIWDVVNHPGWKFPLEYAMPVKRKNATLTYQLILLLDQLFPEAASRHMMENTIIQVMLRHSGKLIQMQHKAACILSSSRLLSPPVGDDVPTIEEEPLPEIYPLSPFLHCKQHHDYSSEEYYSVATSNICPHTVFIHLNMPRMPHTEDNFCGITLLKAFSHAAAYAKHWCKIENGNLEKPLVVQIVHTNGTKYHVGVFQLNTLNLNGFIKNIFWNHPLETLYESCSFKAAEPNLEGYNPKVFSLLRALYLQ